MFLPNFPRDYPEIFLKSATAVIIYEESLRLKYLFPRQSYFASPCATKHQP